MDPHSNERRKERTLSDKFEPGADIRKYVENRIELFSITVAEQVALTVSASIQKYVGLLFLSFGALFLWIALGFFLGDILNNQALGFFLASLPLLLFGFILYNKNSKKLEKKIQADIIEKIAVNFDQVSTSQSYSVNEKKKLK